MQYYKIIEEKDGTPKTLFHGVEGSRTIPLDQWIEADLKMVRDGTSKTYYLSGFHVIPSLEETKEYLTRFKHRENKVIVEVDVDEKERIWPKEHSRSNVLLVKMMRLTTSQWNNRITYNEREYV